MGAGNPEKLDNIPIQNNKHHKVQHLIMAS
jgi:hypothetical protein